MEQEKIGKLISELRKEKNLTQEELAKMFSVAPQTVSKWERGINMPDILILDKLCKILDVDIKDLLRGEKYNSRSNNSKENIEENEKVIIDGIKYYEKRAKNKIFKRASIIFSILITLIAIISILYCINNYNQIKIYKVSSNEDNFAISGRIIFNPYNRIITINDIRYNDIYVGTNKEVKAKSIVFRLKVGTTTIYETGDLEFDKKETAQNLNYYLEKIEIDISQSKKDLILNGNDLNNCFTEIEYVDVNNDVQTINFNLNLEKEFINNNLFYN